LYKPAVLLALLSFSSVAAFAATAAPPKVVFIGDQFTYMWATTPPFAANPNWINQGWDAPVSTYCWLSCQAGTSGGTAARFQADVINLHPAIVHIMVGVDDFDFDDDEGQAVGGPYPAFLTNLEEIVSMAKAANIQVILGLESLSWVSQSPTYPEGLNAIVAAFGAQNNIPVINYDFALSVVGSSPYLGPVPSVVGEPAFQVPTAAGYALMTQMAEVAILGTLGLEPGGGYLQNITMVNADGGLNPNVNSITTGYSLQFTPYGWYNNNPLVAPFVNATFAGSTGTWTSSNPLVMTVTQSGFAYALTPGTAAITYTSPTGVKFNEWVMTVGCLGCTNN
jgi:GDSL-like Lipase/Acylhydrolase family